jgi:Homeodomain-like domain
VGRCSAKTKSGKRCRRRPAAGGERCHAHSGADDVGAPDGLTPEAERRIVQAVRTGATREVAAAAAGVSRRTLQRWLARGAVEDAPEHFRRLAAAVDQAGAQREVEALARIAMAGRDDWKADAWYLRFVRGYPAHHEHSGGSRPGDQAVRISRELITDPALRAELAALKRRIADSRRQLGLHDQP